MRILKENTIALIIDIQERLLPVIAENTELTANTQRLIEGLKVLGIPMLVSEQYRKGLGNTVPEISNLIQPFESMEKLAFSCCDDDGIMAQIKASGKTNVIICGIESHICVLQTTLDLIENGFTPVVIADCIGSRKASDKKTGLYRMRSEGAVISSYESILFELCRYAGNEQFKAISKLIK
jgi:nicotinamidase-related amidase